MSAGRGGEPWDIQDCDRVTGARGNGRVAAWLGVVAMRAFRVAPGYPILPRRLLGAWILFVAVIVLVFLAGRVLAEEGGGIRIGVFPRHNEYIHPTTNQMEKWVGSVWQDFELGSFQVRAGVDLHLGNTWPEATQSYRWAWSVVHYDLVVRWPKDRPLKLWYRKQRDVLIGHRLDSAADEVCNCTFGNSVGVEYTW